MPSIPEEPLFAPNPDWFCMFPIQYHFGQPRKSTSLRTSVNGKTSPATRNTSPVMSLPSSPFLTEPSLQTSPEGSWRRSGSPRLVPSIDFRLSLKTSTPEMPYKPKVDGILEYILHGCFFGTDDHRKCDVVWPKRNTYVPKKKSASRPNTKRGCTCHFIVKRLIVEPSMALIIYNQDKHLDKKGLPCHGPQDKKAIPQLLNPFSKQVEVPFLKFYTFASKNWFKKKNLISSSFLLFLNLFIILSYSIILFYCFILSFYLISFIYLFILLLLLLFFSNLKINKIPF